MQHVEGKSEPALTIDSDYFQRAMEKLRYQLKEPAENINFPYLEDNQNTSNWHEKIRTSFGLETERNLRRFERDDYCIPGHASGFGNVKDLVQFIVPAYSLHYSCTHPRTARAGQ